MGERYCDVCNINVAMQLDCREFRNIENAPEEHEFHVCGKCGRLNNFWFSRIYRAKNKQQAIEELLEGSWEGWTAHDGKKSGEDGPA